MRLLSWMPSSLAVFLYTTLLKPKPVRRLADAVLRRLIRPQVEIEGAKLLLNRDDAIVSGALSLGCYEKFFMRFFQAIIRPGDCVIDIGANIGLYTVLASRRVGPAGRVIAVEPDRVNASILRRNLELNGMSNVTVAQCAISNTNGKGHLYLHDMNKGKHRIFESGDGRPSVEIELRRLDDLLDQLGVKTIDLIKMDVEGAEGLALEGMRRTLEVNPNLRFMLELHPWAIRKSGCDPARILQVLRDGGYLVHELTERKCVLRAPAEDGRFLSLNRERQRADLFMQRQPFAMPSIAG